METLVRLTGSVPPTPPVSEPNTPSIKALRTPRDTSAPGSQPQSGWTSPANSKKQASDDLPFEKTPVGSPESPGRGPIIGANSASTSVQYGAITRKFYSKQVPPISLEDYLLRIEKFCPLSTAVYLAAAVYVHRIAVVQRLVYVTSLTVHRLVLAALRVASKALEDRSHPHRRFAKVGGLSEAELGRLEISFCFITNFELKVDAATLQREVKSLRETAAAPGASTIHPKLPLMRDRRPSQATAASPA
jgi:hypothetical protein